MQYAEVIFETGAHSICSVDDLDAFKEGLKIQHNRAATGERGGPVGHPAERIVKVLLYDDHPAEYGATINSKELSKALEGVAVGGEVSPVELRQVTGELMSPMFKADEVGPHDSAFKMKETGELDLSFLEDK